MKLFKLTVGVLFLSAFFYSCSPLKQLESAQSEAELSYSSGNYTQAYTQLSSLITKYKQSNVNVPYGLLLKAAQSATEINNSEGALTYFKQALSDSVTLVAVKGLINNLNEAEKYKQEEAALSTYADFLKQSGEENYLFEGQFQNNVNNANQDKIISSYKKLTNPTEHQAMIYIKAVEGLGRKKEAVDFCNALVKENPEYLEAREWKALYYYNVAEDWYQSEMDKYNKDKNYTAYVYLKRELKKISAKYHISKTEWEALHKANPESTKYIKYLKNTYLRLDMKNEAAAMDKLLN